MKRTNICKTCSKPFEINTQLNGKNICLSNRSRCLRCSPKKERRSEEVENFIIDNYSDHGVSWCVENSQLTKNQINGIVKKFNLKISKVVSRQVRSKAKTRKAEDCKVNHENFLNIVRQEEAYILGLLWTDGHVSKDTNGIIFSTTSPDDYYFYPIFQKTGNWGYCKSASGHGWKDHISINTSNFYLREFLLKHNFRDKEKGFSQLYALIPKEFQNAFLIGLVDGDGCFYINKQKGLYRFSVCSSYDQDWTAFEEILRRLQINWKIERTQSKSGSYSKIHIFGRERVKKFGDLLYKDYETDKIGLPRKYTKFLEIKNSPTLRSYPKTLEFQEQ